MAFHSIHFLPGEQVWFLLSGRRGGRKMSWPAISQLCQYSSLTNTSMTQYRIESGSKWESTQEAIHSSRTAFHLTAGLVDIADSVCLDNPLMYLPHCHMSLNSIWCSHWQSLSSKLSKSLTLDSPTRQRACPHLKSLNVISMNDFLWFLVGRSLLLTSCVGAP